MVRPGAKSSLRIYAGRVTMKRIAGPLLQLLTAGLLLALIVCSRSVNAEYLQEFEVRENVQLGTVIGFIGQPKNGGQAPPPAPPYYVVPVANSDVDRDLVVVATTGEIRTNTTLDRESRAEYSFTAIPVAMGENVRVVIRVQDENDNAPQFPANFIRIEFAENAPRDAKRTLAPARDRDLGQFNTQRYEIISGNTNNAFKLSYHRERDEVLYLDLQVNGVLDREITPSYSLVVEAYDGGTPALKDTLRVNITIQDVNDNQPIFNQGRYVATIPENATVGTSVLRVFATDTDAGRNGEVRYLISRRQSDRKQFFTIDAKTGEVFVNKPLDYETKELHELVVIARDNGAQPLETTTFVSIRVTDVNDNTPTISLIFLSDDTSPRISEDAKVGDFIGRISVSDPDSREEYANINVTLHGGDGHFGLTTRDNVIYLVVVKAPLDREQQANYTMSIMATDQGVPPLNASSVFNLAVTDVNDNPPVFSQTEYTVNIPEVAEPGFSVLQLRAVDRDVGENAELRYELLDDPSGWFKLDAVSGLLTTKAYVDCETNPNPVLSVVARDRGTPRLSATARVSVTVSDFNDNEPLFDQSYYNVTVAEDTEMGTCILKVSASDPDCGVNAIVNFGLGPSAPSAFRIDPRTGELCVATRLDRELRATYEIPVMATDRGGLSTSTVVKVHVLDINDHRPKFLLDEYNVSLSEFFDQTTQPIVVVVATDRDTGLNGRVTYSIVEGNAQKRFRIDPSTGGIYITSALRRSSGGMTHHLVVTARDGQGVEAERPAHVHVHVSVIGAMSSNQQRTPVFDAPRYVFPVREDVTPHSVVGNVIARAADQGSHGVRYAIRSGNDQGLFTIDPIRGLISVEKTLDFETAASVLLNVQAAAGNPPAYGHAQVNISIEDVNDNNPCFESSEVRISVAENTSLSSPLYSAHAEDADSGENGRVTYALAEESDSFKVVARTGAIMLKRSLDYELRQQYRLILVARDGGQPTRTGNTTIIVEVQDVNDNAPVFEHESYRVTIDESLQLDEHFLQVVAADSDSGNNARITYRLVETESGGTISPRFGISPNTGQIFLRQRLDRESEESYELSVEAVDNGSPSLSAQALVHVTISDANDNEPQFLRDSFEFAVEENAEPGRRAGEAQAVDKDLGDNAALRYVLLSCDNEFYINPASGEMFTKMRLDREKRSSYECVVEARDQGSTPKSSRVSVRIRVLDKNDNAPQFIDNQETDFSVREEQPAGSEVAHVRATDSDEGANAEIVYEIEATGAPSDGAQLFSVNSDGLIRTKSVLDHEQQDMYTLRVVAKDMGSPSLEAKLDLTIKVQDVNDNQPSFFSSTISFTIQEGLPPGREVGVVEAFDQDKGQNGLITYTIVSGNPFNTFSIDRSNGVLYTNVEIDFERTPDFALQVSASDNNVMDSRGSVINVNIRVEDVNDNAPKFATDPIVFSVSESASPGSVLTTITARDEDSGLNGEVRYSIAEAGPGKQTFTIDPVSGAVTLIEPLDYEKQPQYVFVVKAQDQARDMESQLSSKATITLLVEDENDNSPEIVSKNYVEVLEDEDVGAVVTTILASDRDSRENGRITFRIQSGDIHGNFHLDENTGRLTIARRLDRELTQEIVLNITARDNGRSRRYTVQSLRVKIRDVNDCAPMFVQRSYYVNVTETKPIGSTLLRVSTKDNDVSGGSNVTYTLHQDPSIPFTVDAITGEVRITAVLDREQCDRYNLTIFTDDGATPVAHFDSANLIIDVLDANDHAPDFGESCYPLYIPENRGLSVIHRLHANDRDAGQNGDVIYNIAEGNDGNMFAIDPYSGSLSCKGLDRETLPVYRLTIHAQDQGVPPKIGRCNLEVHVLDQNDNDPQFEHSEYSAQVKEDAEIGTEVLMVKAHDIDEGANGKVTYSLINATGVPFGIDSETGHILTTGHFDREHEQSYTLEVRASDNGAYESRFHSATVHIAITDANDHKPVFIRYPFIAEISPDAPIGAKIERVVAEDDDDGQNADVSYTFSEQGLHNNLFNIDPYSGQVTLVQSVYNYNGKVLHVEIVASDRGEVPKSSLGVLEVHVGKTSHHQELHFEQEKYAAYILENPNYGAEITTIRAFNDLMSSQDITYSFDSDSDEFSINHSTGVVRVNNSLKLNYKQQQAITTIVIAKSIRNGEPSYGYARLQVNLRDKNDNTPRFSQTHYVASVAEGNRRGEVVVQLSAIDEDEEHGNGHVMYHIVDGNHDNAFAVDTSSPGVIRTNIVLDREIRDTYTLTVIATDEGLPPLTGTTTVHVSVVDVNDNQPVFPPYDPLKVREDKLVGGVVSVITANDVDAHPALVYNLRNSDNTFTIDAFSGQLTLARQLDFETQTNYSVTVMATDGAHTAETTVSVIVLDVNDHAPKFNESAYTAMLSSSSGGVILTVNATDADLSDNNRVTYKIRPKCEFLKINRKTGEISLREGVSLKPNVIAYLSVVAEDEGSPSFSTAVPLRIQTSSLLEKPYNFAEKSYSASILESAPIGSTVANLSTVDLHNGAKTAESKLSFDIYEGNEDGLFAIDSKGRVQTAGRLDRETQRHFELKVVAFPHRKREIINVTTVLAVDVNDVNDSPPVFSKSRYEILLSELTRVGTMILQVVAIDKDAESDVAYDITSGNEKGQFEIGNRTGNIVLLKELDFDATEEFRFIVRAIDLLNPALASLVGVSIKVKDENDNAPVFPVSRYNEFVQESAPVGSVVFTAHASDRDKGRYGALNYSILEADARDKFSINAESGLVTTNAVFDFESKKRYHFTVVAIDAGGKYAHAQVQVDIQGKDEYPPEFLKPVYHFTVPGNAPKGYGVGRVEATDVDGGSDGIVSYWLRSPTQPNFQVNATTGVIYVVEPISSPKRVVEIALTVEAGSGRTNSLTSLTTVQLTVDFSLNASLVTENLSESGVAAWIYALLILLGFALLILLSLMLFSKYRTLSKEANKPEAARGFEDTIDAMDARRYPNLTYPPHYNEISHYDTPDEAHMTTGYDKRCVSSRSADEDDEIRMINEGRMLNMTHRAHCGGEDATSVISAQNTQEYLARLGIYTGSEKSTQGDYAKIEGGDCDGMSNIIYEKLDDLDDQAVPQRGPPPVKMRQPPVAGSLSSIVHSEEEVAGSYNWDYLNDWSPQYHKLPNLFAEMAKISPVVGSGGDSGGPSGPPHPGYPMTALSSGDSSNGSRRSVIIERLPPTQQRPPPPPMPPAVVAAVANSAISTNMAPYPSAMTPSFDPCPPPTRSSEELSPVYDVSLMAGPHAHRMSLRSIVGSRAATLTRAAESDSEL